MRLLFLSLFLILFSIYGFAQSVWNPGSSGGKGDLITVFFVSGDKGFAAGDDGFLVMTNNGGRTWEQIKLEMTDNINEIYFRNDDNGYLVAGRKMFATRDGGRSWQEIKIFSQNDFRNLTPEFLSIRFTDKKRGFVIGSVLNKDERVVDSLVMQTKDGGENWTRVPVPTKQELFHLDFNGTSNGWIVGDDGLILRTSDGGENWLTQNSGTTRALYNVDFRDNNEGFIVGGYGTILRTEDGGEHWLAVRTNYPDTFLRVDFADDKNGWIVGYKGAILRSADRGRTWIRQDSQTSQNIYGLFMNKKYGYAVGANGLILTYQK